MFNQTAPHVRLSMLLSSTAFRPHSPRTLPLPEHPLRPSCASSRTLAVSTAALRPASLVPSRFDDAETRLSLVDCTLAMCCACIQSHVPKQPAMPAQHHTGPSTVLVFPYHSDPLARMHFCIAAGRWLIARGLGPLRRLRWSINRDFWALRRFQTP
jgi:hypothetical protein